MMIKEGDLLYCVKGYPEPGSPREKILVEGRTYEVKIPLQTQFISIRTDQGSYHFTQIGSISSAYDCWTEFFVDRESMREIKLNVILEDGKV